MSDLTAITCPNCHTSIPLSDAFRSQLKGEVEKELSEKLLASEKKLAEERQLLVAQEKQLRAEKEAIDQQVQTKLEAEKKQMWAIAQKKAEEKLALEMKDSKEENAELRKKLEETQAQELELRKEKRRLEEMEKTMKMELERTLDEERKRIMEQSKKEAQEEGRMKMLEKDKQLAMMHEQIEALKRKAEQGSMQIQGEVQEADMKLMLSQHFPLDTITDVPTGIRGADLVQTVRSPLGKEAGVMLWESKNTKAWSNEWIKKLKDDQGLAKADVCLLVTRVLPEGITTFGMVEGVWVLSYDYVVPLTIAVRKSLIDIASAKASLVGREEKMELLYTYLSGTQFKHHVEQIVLAFTSMKQDLESEKRALSRIWAKREKEIERVIGNTTGLYGDLQGIIGASLPTIQSLELPLGDEEEGQS